MPHESTTGELIRLLSRYDPDTPVLLPMPTPLELPVTKTIPAYRDSLNPDILVSTTIRNGRQCVLLGDQRQTMAELPDTEGTTVFKAAVLRELDDISALTGIYSLDRPIQPILPAGSTGDVHRTLNSLTRPNPGSKTPSAMILQGLRSNTHDDNTESQETLLLILTVEVPNAGHAEEAAEKASTLARITTMPTAAAVVSTCTAESWPLLPAATLHVLAWAERQCPYCDLTFRTARGLRTHRMLEAGCSEIRSRIPGYWQRYMDDLADTARHINTASKKTPSTSNPIKSANRTRRPPQDGIPLRPTFEPHKRTCSACSRKAWLSPKPSPISRTTPREKTP